MPKNRYCKSYRRASVIILDEATSALDNKTELSVMKEIEKLGDSITLIIIAHRLTTRNLVILLWS